MLQESQQPDPTPPESDEALAQTTTTELNHMLHLLFGPTADYITTEVASMHQKRRTNAIRIIKTAIKRLGDNITDAGGIPPRIAGLFLNNGTFCNTLVSTCYWAGLLVSAHSAHPQDDRAIRWLNVVSRLSEYELRTHYLYYSTLRLLLMNFRQPSQIDLQNDRFHLATFIPTYPYMVAMGFQETEVPQMPKIISSILYGIGQELLVDGSNSGSDIFLKKHFKTNTTDVIKGEGVVFTPSILGIRLFLWSFGYKDAEELYILDPRLISHIPTLLTGIPHAGLVYS